MIQKIGTLGNAGGPLLVDRIVTNSLAVAVGYAMRTTAGFAALATTGSRVLGHVESLVGADGLSPVKDGTYLGNIGEVFTATADNQTVAKVRVRMDVDTRSIYSAELDAAFGTTTGSGLAGKYFSLADKDTLDESTLGEVIAVLTEGTPNTIAYKQYYSHGVDASTPANAVVNIVHSEVFGA